MPPTPEEIPEDVVRALGLQPSTAAAEVRMAAAVMLFDQGRLSSGMAARLAGIPRVVFLSKLGEWGVNTFRATEDELEEDAASA